MSGIDGGQVYGIGKAGLSQLRMRELQSKGHCVSDVEEVVRDEHNAPK